MRLKSASLDLILKANNKPTGDEIVRMRAEQERAERVTAILNGEPCNAKARQRAKRIQERLESLKQKEEKLLEQSLIQKWISD